MSSEPEVGATAAGGLPLTALAHDETLLQP